MKTKAYLTDTDTNGTTVIEIELLNRGDNLSITLSGLVLDIPHEDIAVVMTEDGHG